MGSYGRRGYIPDILGALTGGSWGLPKESLGSAQRCVGPLVRYTGAFLMNYRVPLSSLWGPMGEGDTLQISSMPSQGAILGLPRLSLGSVQGCVGPLVRCPGAFPGNYKVPLSPL